MPLFEDHFLDNDNQWETRDDERVLSRIAGGDYANGRYTHNLLEKSVERQASTFRQ